MKYIIDDQEFTDAREAADYIMENADEEYYDEMLDECCEEVKIGSLTYAPSVALYRVDEVAYNCGRAEWKDAEADSIAYELERTGNGKTNNWYDCTVKAVDDDNEDEDDE